MYLCLWHEQQSSAIAPEINNIYIYRIYGLHYKHEVHRTGKVKNTNAQAENTDCTEDELYKEFSNFWPVFDQLWPEYWYEPKTSHQRFLDHILSNYSTTHSNISELLCILIAVASSTGSIERSLNNSRNICHKHRNQLTTKNLFKWNEVD